MKKIIKQSKWTWVIAAIALLSSGCSDDSSNRVTPIPPSVPAPSPVEVNGMVLDGAVSGGTIFVYAASDISAALVAAAGSADRSTALAGADPIVSLTRDPADEEFYQLVIPAGHEGEALFFVFDNSGAEDLLFGDTPFNLESMVIADSSAGSQRVNITPHTTLATQLVRAALDPDGDGTVISVSEIETEMDDALGAVISALGQDDEGEQLLTSGINPIGSTDAETLERASSFIGLTVRTSSALTGLTADEVMQALAADAADGERDGVIPASLAASEELQTAAESINDVSSSVDIEDLGGGGACSESALAMRQACEFDIKDDLFEGRASCVMLSDEEELEECIVDVTDEHGEGREECEEVLDARLDLCEELEDEAHHPDFGTEFADNFVDPLEIGSSVEPNPYLPLVPGTRWVYEGSEEETVTVTVTQKTKLIEGITCIVVNDVEEEDGVIIENTNDWFAQDVDGNVWYCGEIAENFEVFEGDDPEDPELVDIEGSWKAGHEGGMAGILIPAEPEVGDLFRQEMKLGDAEDAMEILSVTGTEESPAAACTETCLVTLDFTPLEPGVEENKYYVPGIGLIVEIDLETGDRVELVEFSQP